MKNNSSKSGLFLMELIIAILFFSLAGTVCIQMFVSSHSISRESVELNHSVEWCQNIAEIFYGCNGKVSDMLLLFNNSCTCDTADSEGTQFYLLFDEDFQPVSISSKESDCLSTVPFTYFISVTLCQKDSLLLCTSEAFRNTSLSTISADKPEGISIYQLENTLYVQEISNGE